MSCIWEIAYADCWICTKRQESLNELELKKTVNNILGICQQPTVQTGAWSAQWTMTFCITANQLLLQQTAWSGTVKPLILATLNFGVWVNLIILDPVIWAFLLPTTLRVHTGQGKLEKVREFEWSGKMQKWLKSQGNFGGKFYLFVQLL